MAFDPTTLGHLIEGVVERDPMTDHYVIRTLDHEGKRSTFDVQAALAKCDGKEIRFTLATFDNLAKLSEIVEAAGAGGQVTGLAPDNLPGAPFEVHRKPE